MIVPSTIEKSQNELASGPPRFQMAPPGTNPFVANEGVLLTESDEKFSVGWIEEQRGIGDIPSADQVFQNVVSRSRRDVEVHPRSARAHFGLGLALLNNGNWDEAAGEFESALSLDPDHYAALMNLGRIRIVQKRLQEAQNIYSRLEESRPSDPAPKLSSAFVAMLLGDFAKAAEVLSEALALDDGSVLTHAMMAVACLHERRLNESISHLKKAAHSDVRLPALHQALGVTYAVKGDLSRAIRSFKAALVLAPGMPEATRGLANVYLRVKKAHQAVDCLQGYLEANPSDVEARDLLARAYAEDGNFSAARTQLTRLYEQLKEMPCVSSLQLGRTLNNVGVCYERSGQRGLAESYFQRAVREVGAGDPVPYHNLALVYFKSGRRVDALQLLTQSKERFPEDQRGRLMLSAACRELGRVDEATDELESLVGLENPLPEVFIELSSMLAEIKRNPEEAIKVSAEGLLRFPKSAALINNLAYAHLVRGEVSKARVLLNSFPRSKWPKGTATEVALTATLGLLHLFEGKLAQGKDLYKQAENLAGSMGSRELVRKAQQKSFLELGRALAKARKYGEALRQVELGLRIKEGFTSYRDDLEALGEQIRKLQAHEPASGLNG